jgi:hypothetical protein
MFWRSLPLILLVRAAAPAGEPTPGIPAAAPPPPAARAGRPAVSREIASAITAGLPGYVHPKPSLRPAAIADESEVVRLPRMVVFAPRVPVIDERDLWSKSGFSALLRARYPGASFRGQDPDHSPLPNYAALMYAEDRRQRRMNALSELARALRRTGDAAGSRELKRLIEDTFLRQEDWKTEGMDKTLNPWRR